MTSQPAAVALRGLRDILLVTIVPENEHVYKVLSGGKKRHSVMEVD